MGFPIEQFENTFCSETVAASDVKAIRTILTVWYWWSQVSMKDQGYSLTFVQGQLEFLIKKCFLVWSIESNLFCELWKEMKSNLNNLSHMT